MLSSGQAKKLKNRRNTVGDGSFTDSDLSSDDGMSEDFETASDASYKAAAKAAIARLSKSLQKDQVNTLRTANIAKQTIVEDLEDEIGDSTTPVNGAVRKASSSFSADDEEEDMGYGFGDGLINFEDMSASMVNIKGEEKGTLLKKERAPSLYKKDKGAEETSLKSKATLTRMRTR